MLAILISIVFLQSIPNQPFDHSLYDAVLKSHVIDGYVDYGALRSDKRLTQYLQKLEKADVYALPKDEQLALWINAYNAYTLKLIIDHYPVKSIREIGNLLQSAWKKRMAPVAGKTYTLDEIEHEIIRVEFDEPRIHFAVVCAAISCPPLRNEAFTGKKLDSQLADQVKQFYSDSSKNRIDEKNKVIYLSKIVDWYKGDFEKHGDFRQIMLGYFGVPDSRKPSYNQYKIEFMDYDWTLNGK